MRTRLAAAILAMTVTLVSDVMAFDDILRFAPTFPVDLATPVVFDYSAPLGGFKPDAPTLYGPSDRVISLALLEAAAPEPVTGVDFSAVEGVLTVGEPPSTLTVLFGPTGFAQATPVALAARGFEQHDLDGLTVMAKGEDYAIDIAAARQPDPFGDRMGKSQRITLGGDFLIRSFGWPETRAAVAALQSPSPQSGLWIATIIGLRAASGDAAHLDIATGFAASAFVDAGPDIGDMLADPTGTMKSEMKKKPQENPIVFPFALFALSQNADTASTQVALPFGSQAEAAHAGAVIADRLVAHPFTPSRPRIHIEQRDAYWVAVLSIDFPVAEASAARDLYARWMRDIYERNFPPLTIGF